MTEITMAKMSQLSETQKEVREIFVTSYYKDMKTLHRDTERLLGGFRRLLQEDLIRVAMDGERPVAMVGCSTNQRRAMEVNKRISWLILDFSGDMSVISVFAKNTGSHWTSMMIRSILNV